MSTFRGAWDGGPPGAEAEYAGQTAPPPAPQPTTDPWTGVSYNQYPSTAYDYQAYGHPYSYNYYHQQQGPDYYSNYPPDANTYMQQGYGYPPQPQQPHSSAESNRYEQKHSHHSKSRSVSPYARRERSYSQKRDSSYDEKRRSRSKSLRRNKYLSSDKSSSRSRSYSRSPKREQKRKSSSESRSKKSYKKKSSRGSDHSLTPPIRNRSHSRSCNKSRPDSDRSASKSPIDDRKKYKSRKKSKGKKQKDFGSTPPRKRKSSVSSGKSRERSSLSPPKRYKSRKSITPTRYRYRDHKSCTPPRKVKETSLTPPRSYARNVDSLSHKSHSRSTSPHFKTTHSDFRHSTSRSRSMSSRRSHSSSKRKSRRSRQNSRSKSSSRNRSDSRSSSRSRSKRKRKHSTTPRTSKSRSRSKSGRSSGTPSDDDRRGQFTVADRKRFWKLQRSKQEEREKDRTPPKEVKPPPGAVEAAHIDDIEYGDPPEVEGPNFAELLPTRDQVMQMASTSKKPIPIPIKNDGSFLEMFKKMQEETKKEEKKPEMKKPVLPFIGKRRGGRVLKTGLVKKAKAIDEQTVDNTPKDAWSLYMQEVKKYRETSCEEERKTRPLVK